MRITRISQPAFESLASERFDYVLASSGYESRARYVAEELHQLNGMKASQKIAWGFKENPDAVARRKNDKLLSAIGFRSFQMSGSDTESPEQEFRKILQRRCGSTTKVLVDLSSMTRAWYAGVVRALRQTQRTGSVTTYFAYVPAKWAGEILEYPPNEFLGPARGFAGHGLPNKATALIVGLGHDRDRAIGLKSHLDPQLTLAFYASLGTDVRYEQQLLEANRDFLDLLNPKDVFTYPMRDCVSTFKTLESVARGLAVDWRIVLCSTGPKLFSLMCFLLSCYYPEISVWMVSAGSKQKPVDHEPGAKPIMFQVEWE